jgi:hypothetical protein
MQAAMVAEISAIVQSVLGFRPSPDQVIASLSISPIAYDQHILMQSVSWKYILMVHAVEQPLMEAGLDSLGAVELRNSLNARLAVDLAPTVTLDFPSITALAAHLATAAAPSDAFIGADEVASITSLTSYSQELQVKSNRL